jgi:hypothetical protein
MALADLNRSNDTPISTLKLAEVPVKNWHRFPARVGPGIPPVYVPTITYFGGAFGDEIDTATANSTDDYAPKTQAAKAALMVPAGALAVDVTRSRGWIEPGQAYGAIPADPTLTGIAPATAVHGTAAVQVTLTGTGFTRFSKVRVDGVSVPFTYVSPTSLIATVTPKATAGTQLVTAVDHSVNTASQNFVVT